jgi:glycyl-tRNA synthetase beta subunit
MGLYVNDTSNKRIIIKIEDIVEFAKSLKKYVDTYYANIYIMDKDDLNRLDRLNDIADALLSRRFNGVLEPTVEIDYGDDYLFNIPF